MGCSVGASSSAGTGGVLPRDPSGEHRRELSAPKPRAYAPEYAFLSHKFLCRQRTTGPQTLTRNGCCCFVELVLLMGVPWLPAVNPPPPPTLPLSEQLEVLFLQPLGTRVSAAPFSGCPFRSGIFCDLVLGAVLWPKSVKGPALGHGGALFVHWNCL